MYVCVRATVHANTLCRYMYTGACLAWKIFAKPNTEKKTHKIFPIFISIYPFHNNSIINFEYIHTMNKKNGYSLWHDYAYTNTHTHTEIGCCMFSFCFVDTYIEMLPHQRHCNHMVGTPNRHRALNTFAQLQSDRAAQMLDSPLHSV